MKKVIIAERSSKFVALLEEITIELLTINQIIVIN